jgi:hypothetical protein
MSNFEKSMGEIFDIAPAPPKLKQEILPVVRKQSLPVAVSQETLEEDLVDAYEQTKTNLQDLIDQGKDAMDEILLIAKNGQHPRAFEVYGTLLKNVVEANRELLSVQRQMRDMDKKNQVAATTIDKAIFIGSTSELNRLIKGKD